MTTEAGHDRRVTLTVAGIVFMLLLDSTILNTSLPSIARALDVAPLDLSASVTVYLLAAAAILPMSSWLGTRFGLRRVFVASIAAFTLASLACGCSQNLAQLLIARALQGLGGGLMLPVGRTLALHRARSEDIIGVSSLLTWPALFAPVLGPPLGGFITTYASWRWNFLLNVPLGVAAIVALFRLVAVETPTERRPLDVPGAVGAAAGLMLLLGGLEWLAHAEGPAQLGAAACALSGGASLAWTARHLRRTRHPVVSLAPFERRTFAVATAAGGTFASMALQSTPFLLPLMFQLALGRGAVAAGALLLPYFLGNLGMKSITTPVLVRFGFRRVMVVSGLGNAIAIAGFAAVQPGTAWLMLIAWLVFAGCTRSMLLTAVNTLAFAQLPPAQRGAASTLSAVSMQVAGALGVACGAVLLAFSRDAHARSALQLADFQLAFAVMGAVCAVTVIQFWRLPHDAGADVTGRTAAGPRA
ncbi:MAG TPA: MFS transporter [Ramlibacter sp.]|uniref:MFS transporter n=1 Tax=Ramlibacter sp. TaxID=1917967 RepID=UPI002B7EF5D0|nr:MFS transporter [Ramlibacter sp.]HVZ45948.1 MFS transporter [Ramlibacter sp.]